MLLMRLSMLNACTDTITHLSQTHAACFPCLCRYAWYDYSAPVLPKGLAMSSTMRLMTSTRSQSYTGLR